VLGNGCPPAHRREQTELKLVDDEEPPDGRDGGDVVRNEPTETNAGSAAHHDGEHRGDEDLDNVAVEDETDVLADHVVRLDEARRALQGVADLSESV